MLSSTSTTLICQSSTFLHFSFFTLLLYLALPLHFYIPAPLPILHCSAHDSRWPMQKAKSWGRTGVTTGNARKQQPSAAFLRRCTTRASTDGVRRRAIMVVCVPEEVGKKRTALNCSHNSITITTNMSIAVVFKRGTTIMRSHNSPLW